MSYEEQQQMEFELKPHYVFCECCSEQDRGSQKDLEARGWTLSQQGEFCWRHRD